MVEEIDLRNTGVGRSMLGVLIRQGTHYLRAVWFNQPFMREKFSFGQRVMLSGRIDYLDMRGPKIAVGLDAERNLTVLTVNGRIRESVGATHVDMAEIMQSLGVGSAMGFDPGGSSTLVVGRETVNISPYNPDYERNVYALPPEPRGVANVVIGY